MGTNTLAGIEEERIVQEGRRSLSGNSMPSSRPPLWDGHAGERAADLLVRRTLAASAAGYELAPASLEQKQIALPV